ncbi:hypothetical protein EYF80_022702 [Liparis tanakae]|uniref:Uncharacterized protein n=1 Tax=Liparis tanakae TaxID=230148 RepID=A0A4Z2HMI0_9TELE|nr:hypothetical protein EYF80_022702 [Liparis tanakae]
MRSGGLQSGCWAQWVSAHKALFVPWLQGSQDASHPPATGHDDSARHPAPSVVVRPRPVSAQRLADPLTVSVAASALGTADPLVVQHGVKGHGRFLSGASAALQV